MVTWAAEPPLWQWCRQGRTWGRPSGSEGSSRGWKEGYRWRKCRCRQESQWSTLPHCPQWLSSELWSAKWTKQDHIYVYLQEYSMMIIFSYLVRSGYSTQWLRKVVLRNMLTLRKIRNPVWGYIIGQALIRQRKNWLITVERRDYRGRSQRILGGSATLIGQPISYQGRTLDQRRAERVWEKTQMAEEFWLTKDSTMVAADIHQCRTHPGFNLDWQVHQDGK